MKQRQYGIRAIFILSTCILVSSCKNNKQESAQKEPIEVKVVTLRAQKFTLTKELPGRTSAYRIAEIRPQVDGIILKRQFMEGSNVISGGELYQIDPAKYQASYDNAKGNLAQAAAALEVARLKEKRYKNLLPSHAVSQQDYDDARASLKQAEANILSSQADVELALINLNYTHIKSPLNGRIGKSNFTEGALVTANQSSALAIVQQLDPIYVDITQPMVELLHLKKQFAAGNLKNPVDQDLKLKLILEDESVYKELGTLQFTDVTVDSTTGSVTIRGLFPNPDFDLMPGSFVRVVIEQGVQENALLVPQPSVTRDSSGSARVLVVNNKNIVEIRNVTTEQAINDQWLVKEGLKNGDKVILEGIQKVKPGDQVKPLEVLQSSKLPSTNSMSNPTHPQLKKK
ncbi:MAG: efflux RND transporter periplasmic adaptor subunit [Candidatus Paracaedimonas acanthamoebae]|uniref:Efflux RND transporter periplasmic adaptor subunit n=1 Tax=Candidatus Paracaedimonas acanthamoebae TaxID=244581 RepID=A0A8J7TUA1_9PROT|nr:efflux RND transporter periplasmic adaptor subunit [Candidatus Paracaedimonas acanthamoebae]